MDEYRRVCVCIVKGGPVLIDENKEVNKGPGINSLDASGMYNMEDYTV